MADRNVLAEIAAKIAEIASDCFDRPTASRLRDLYADVERMVGVPPLPETDPAPPEQAPP